MDQNPYSPPKDFEQTPPRSFFERLMIVIAAGMTGCFCGAVAFFAAGFLVLFLCISLGGMDYFPDFANGGFTAAYLLGFFVTVIAGFFAHYRFSRPKKSVSEAIAEDLPNT
jgi:hypothetical protein